MTAFQKITPWLLILGMGLFQPVYAVSAFSPVQSATWVVPFWGKPSQEVGFVFYNPAGIASAKNKQFTLSTASDYLGYSTLFSSTVLPLGDWKLGLGLLSFSANDAIQVNATSSRPVSNGQITHQFIQSALSLSRKWGKFSAGLSLSYDSQKLANQNATKASLDPGVMWSESSWWAGLYTQNLSTTHTQWNTETDPTDIRVIGEYGWIYDTFTTIFSTNLNSFRVQEEWELHPMLSLIGDVVVANGLSLQRYSYGTQINLDQVSLHYLRSSNPFDQLPITQDLFGLRITF
jgi:hypothetical protein